MPVEVVKVVDYDSTTRYYNSDGEQHCTDGPAIVRADGNEEYWVNGRQTSQPYQKKISK